VGDLNLNKTSAVALVALAAFGITGCGNKGAAPSKDNIAVVNGEPIDYAAFYDYMERKPLVQVQGQQGAQDAPVVGSLGLQALRDLVTRKVLLQLAKEEGVLPAEADIRKEIEFRSVDNKDFVNMLIANKGMNLESIKSEIAFELARERLLTKGVTVSAQEVETYLKENADKFVVPAQAQLLWIIVRDRNKTRQVDQDLAQGQNFQTVATRYSEDRRVRETGASFPITRIDQMPTWLRDLVNKTPELKATDWRPDGSNFLKFYVLKKSASQPIVMDAHKKEILRRQLALDRGRLANDLEKRLNDRVRQAKIDIRPQHLKRPWDQAVEAAKMAADQAAATSTAGGTGTATTPGGGAGTAVPPTAPGTTKTGG